MSETYSKGTKRNWVLALALMLGVGCGQDVGQTPDDAFVDFGDDNDDASQPGLEPELLDDDANMADGMDDDAGADTDRTDAMVAMALDDAGIEDVGVLLPPPPPPPPPAVALEYAYAIEIIDVYVGTSGWDTLDLADPRVVISLNGQYVGQTLTIANTEGLIALGMTIEFPRNLIDGDDILLQLQDEDISAHDAILTKEVDVTAALAYRALSSTTPPLPPLAPDADVRFRLLYRQAP